ncbi:PREDICTED: nucleobindin-2-like, partial [Priapulus caudatus]|uniref:Nucleobindin-2-like n=1 Tax=Priapulus caudatus TaxID=37621 RepID=A0ABM1ECR1_PRICU
MARLTWLILICLVASIVCPPVDKNSKKSEEDKKKENGTTDNNDIDLLEYDRYLKEIIGALEEDGDFKKKLESADFNDVQSGKIANELQFVNHNVRTKLDEIKRREMERLRQTTKKMLQKKEGRDVLKQGDIGGHIDHMNPRGFDMSDLAKLIQKTIADLETLDTQRKDNFKTYEMEKEYHHKEQVNNMTEEEKKIAEQEYLQQQEKHNDHPRVHHPGSKQQMQDVWTDNDHMDPGSFNPKTFFSMHDYNRDGYLDQKELEALFQTELDKLYDPDNPEDDMYERQEEMARMREHVQREVDTDSDGLISLAEFIAETHRSEWGEDEGWKDIRDEPVFDNEEYRAYEQFMAEQRHLASMDPQRLNTVPPHILEDFAKLPPDQQQQVMLQQHLQNQQQQQHPGQYQQHPGQVDPAQVDPRYQQHPGQVDQQYQQHHDQVDPRYQQHPDQVDQQ